MAFYNWRVYRDVLILALERYPDCFHKGLLLDLTYRDIINPDEMEHILTRSNPVERLMVLFLQIMPVKTIECQRRFVQFLRKYDMPELAECLERGLQFISGLLHPAHENVSSQAVGKSNVDHKLEPPIGLETGSAEPLPTVSVGTQTEEDDRRARMYVLQRGLQDLERVYENSVQQLAATRNRINEMDFLTL